MTRETRIGLLVGLAFIVMFGLVLSELMSAKLPSAPTTPALEAARPTEHAATPPRVITYNPPPVPQRREVSLEAVTPPESYEAPIPAELLPQRVEEQLPAPAPVSSARTYRVQAGDSLRSIARKVYGEETLYKRIFEANRHILPDESTLAIGQVLILPALDGAPQAAAPEPAPRVQRNGGGLEVLTIDQLGERFGRTAPPARTRTYVVRSGDNLSRIAGRMLGDSSQAGAMKIYNANKDKLSDPDSVRVGMELRIPG